MYFVFKKPPLCVDYMFRVKGGCVGVCVERKWLAHVVKVRPLVLPVCVCVHVHVVIVTAFCVDRVLGVSSWYLGDQ